jgi:hypothetical protein
MSQILHVASARNTRVLCSLFFAYTTIVSLLYLIRPGLKPSDGPSAAAHDNDATQIGPRESRIVSARDQDPASANPQPSPLSICGEAAATWRDKHPLWSLGDESHDWRILGKRRL